MPKRLMQIAPMGAGQSGSSVCELLLALSLGLGLSGMILQALLKDSRHAQEQVEVLRERQLRRRVAELVRSDLQNGEQISRDPAVEQHACHLGERTPVLHLRGPVGTITYSVGAAPSRIWRGSVLMRCGPAYGLTGQPAGTSEVSNRVILDNLDPTDRGSADCATDPWGQGRGANGGDQPSKGKPLCTGIVSWLTALSSTTTPDGWQQR